MSMICGTAHRCPSYVRRWIIRSLKSLSASPRMPSSGTTWPPRIMSMFGPLPASNTSGPSSVSSAEARALVVVAGHPLDLDVGVLVGGGVALDRFLDALLAVPVVPLRQRRQVAAAPATPRCGRPPGRAKRRRHRRCRRRRARPAASSPLPAKQPPPVQRGATEWKVRLVHRMHLLWSDCAFPTAWPFTPT